MDLPSSQPVEVISQYMNLERILLFAKTKSTKAWEKKLTGPHRLGTMKSFVLLQYVIRLQGKLLAKASKTLLQIQGKLVQAVSEKGTPIPH